MGVNKMGVYPFLHLLYPHDQFGKITISSGELMGGSK